MKFYFLFLIFLFPCFAYEIKHPIKKVNSAARNFSSKKATPSKSSPQAKGVILKFYNWPDSSEGELIVKYLGQFGLVKKAKVENFKSWIFEWSELGKAVEAQRLCEELLKISNIPSLEYCEPDYSTTTATKQETVNHEGAEYILLRSWVNNRNLSIVSVINFLERKKVPILYVDNPEVPALKAAGKSYSPTVHAIPNTASNQSLLAEFAQGKKGIQTPELQPVQKVVIKPSSVPSSQQNINQNTSKSLRSCSILSSEADLFEGKLSDYWAQEMVGSDLLKEELKKAEPIKKHLVEVFDIPPRHDVGVRNLISDEGQHSVLPEIGDKAGITHTPTNSKALIAADNLLTKVNSVCATSSSSSQQEEGSDSNQQQQSSSKQKTSNQIGGGGSDQQSSSKKKTSNQGGGNSGIMSKNSKNQEQETVSVGEGDSQTEYIMLRAWSNNHHIEISSIISGLKRKGIAMQYVDNPHITDLQEAGESYSPQIYVISNTESNREKLEQVLQSRGRIVYKRDLQVVWQSATNWNEDWKSAIEGDTSLESYDLEATYEVDRERTRQLIRRGYKYIFRPPVLDMRGATRASTSLFNWLPPIVLLKKDNIRKLKVWGTKEVGNGPLTINGVSVSLTMVPSTISDVAGSSKTHGRWETVLTEDQFNTIYNSRISTDSNTPVRKVSSQNVGQTQAIKKTSSQKVQVNKQPPQSGGEVSSGVKKKLSIVFPREWKSSRGGNIKFSHSEDYVNVAQLGKYLSNIGYPLSNEILLGSAPWINGLLTYEDAVNAIPALTARSDQLKKDRAKASAIRRKLQKNPYFYLDMQKAKGGNLPAWVEQWKNDNPEKYDNYKKGNH